MTSAEFTNAHPALARFWHPVALSAEVGQQPVAARVGGQGWALVRFGNGIAAFEDACPHRRARLSAGQVTDGMLQCTYHGWRFTPEGRCVVIPALEDTAAIPERATLRRPAEVAEQDGMVWLAPEHPRAPLPDLHPGVPLGGDGVATVLLPVLRVEANAAILIDNFLDEAHLPFVHAATIGGAGPEPIPRADVDRRGLSFTAVREHTFTNLTDPAVLDGSRPAVQRRRMTYRYQAPLTATLLLEYLDADGWQFLTFTVQPEDDRAVRVYQTVTGPGMTDPEHAESAAKYEMSIFDEDLDLQRRALSGLEFPLDVSAELHTRADRVAVEFRRVLAAAVSALRARNVLLMAPSDPAGMLYDWGMAAGPRILAGYERPRERPRARLGGGRPARVRQEHGGGATAGRARAARGAAGQGHHVRLVRGGHPGRRGSRARRA
jgi:phenylpropionate dioxygenase-like ring-hydroxylating dioxygenase large terminal subunit